MRPLQLMEKGEPNKALDALIFVCKADASAEARFVALEILLPLTYTRQLFVDRCRDVSHRVRKLAFKVRARTAVDDPHLADDPAKVLGQVAPLPAAHGRHSVRLDRRPR